MTIKSSFFSFLLVATAFTFLTNCSGDTKERSHEGTAHEHASGSAGAAEATEPQFQVDIKFQEQLSAVFTSYVDLQEALVASDPQKVKQQASQTNAVLAQVDMTLITGAAHNDWMSYLTPMANSLEAIQSSADIDAQRKSFSSLSDNLYKSVKAFGLRGEQAFYTYCPMALNNEGAYWLSDEEKVRNPYFGDKMLTCGEVKEKLK